MPSIPSIAKLRPNIKPSRSQSEEVMLSKLNDPAIVTKLRALFISKTISLDKLSSRDKALAINPGYFTNKILKLRICLLYIDSISQAIFNNQISQDMYDCAIKTIIETFKTFSKYFVKRHNPWGKFLKTAPEALFLYINNPLLIPSPIETKIPLTFFLNMDQNLLLGMYKAYEKHNHISFILHLIFNRISQKKFLNRLILSLYSTPTSFPLSDEDVSNFISYFIQAFDKTHPKEESLKNHVLTFIMNKYSLKERTNHNIFFLFIKQNHEIAINIIKQDTPPLKANIDLVLKITTQMELPLRPFLKIKRINKKVNNILLNAITKGGHLTQLHLSSKQNKISIFDKISFIFNTILPSENILRNTINMASDHIFENEEISIEFIQKIPPSYRYHFSIALMSHLIKEEKPISLVFLKNISNNLTPITCQSISNSPLSIDHFNFIMAFIKSSAPKTANLITENNLGLLFWMIKYSGKVIPDDYFVNSHGPFLDFTLQDIKFNISNYIELPLVEQIKIFKQIYYSHSNNFQHIEGAIQDAEEPPEKKAHTTPPPAIQLDNSEHLLNQIPDETFMLSFSSPSPTADQEPYPCNLSLPEPTPNFLNLKDLPALDDEFFKHLFVEENTESFACPSMK